MKSTFLIVAFFIGLSACNSTDSLSEKQEGTFPDNIYHSIKCTEDIDWFKRFEIDLAQEKFAIEKVTLESGYEKYDGTKKNYVSVKGTIAKYYIKRQEEEPAGYYPDFVMYVIDLNNEQQAKYCFSDLTMATFSPGKGEERIKEIETMTQNGNRVFILSTRAEMFRSYINLFIHKINKY